MALGIMEASQITTMMIIMAVGLVFLAAKEEGSETASVDETNIIEAGLEDTCKK